MNAVPTVCVKNNAVMTIGVLLFFPTSSDRHLRRNPFFSPLIHFSMHAPDLGRAYWSYTLSGSLGLGAAPALSLDSTERTGPARRSLYGHN